jgi:hypothetical protein
MLITGLISYFSPDNAKDVAQVSLGGLIGFLAKSPKPPEVKPDAP